MKNNEYIMVGTPTITKEIFRKVLIPLNNYDFKPSGGFWSSPYIGNIGISEWYSYLQDARSIARYKNLNQSTIFTLKEDSKILTLNTPEKVLQLAKKYPSIHHKLGYYEEITKVNTIFDFMQLSKDYDGVYIDYNTFIRGGETRVFDRLSVNSLLLFNLDCIKEYRTAPIIYDIDNPYSFPYIIPNTISDTQTIEEESDIHKILARTTEELFLDTINKCENYTFKDYDVFLSTMTITVKIVMEIIKKTEIEKINVIEKYLKSKGIYVKKEHIIQNIVLNYLSEYLSDNAKTIGTIPPSKIRTKKSYPIY